MNEENKKVNLFNQKDSHKFCQIIIFVKFLFNSQKNTLSMFYKILFTIDVNKK